VPYSTREKTLIVGLVTAQYSRSLVEEHLDELEGLIDTAGGCVVDRMIQERERPDPSTLVGSGFLDRLGEIAEELEAQAVVFDEDLTASQVRNIEKRISENLKVLDRAAVILDIFALRARSREAQTQVELAQLNYLLPRLTRRWGHLSRQAGGIGTRGVGEKQLEIDRRIITRRIALLRSKLAVIERDRRLRRKRRSDIPAIALVGYTNAGKSSLFRRLSRAEVLVENRLFATLDPRTRRMDLGHNIAALLVDTVGFVRKLPHHLVAPFRSTLEEASDADLVLHLVDVSHPAWEEQLRVGQKTLDELDVDPSRVQVVLNKIDLLKDEKPPRLPSGAPALLISALEGTGMGAFRANLRHRLLQAPDVRILRIPLEETTAVQRAIALPHQLARYFDDESLSLALYATDAQINQLGLEPYRVPRWEQE